MADTPTAVLHLDFAKSWLLTFLRVIKQQHPQFTFLVDTGDDSHELDSMEEIDSFARHLALLPPTGEPPAAAAAPARELFIFSTMFDRELPRFVERCGARAVNVFRTVPPRAAPKSCRPRGEWRAKRCGQRRGSRGGRSGCGQRQRRGAVSPVSQRNAPAGHARPRLELDPRPPRCPGWRGRRTAPAAAGRAAGQGELPMHVLFLTRLLVYAIAVAMPLVHPAVTVPFDRAGYLVWFALVPLEMLLAYALRHAVSGTSGGGVPGAGTGTTASRTAKLGRRLAAAAHRWLTPYRLLAAALAAIVAAVGFRDRPGQRRLAGGGGRRRRLPADPVDLRVA